jgi:hypothetical protein
MFRSALLMQPYSPVTDSDLARARQDPAFRQKLLTQNLDILLSSLQKHRHGPVTAGASAQQMREGVTLAVRLAELIQNPAQPPRGS